MDALCLAWHYPGIGIILEVVKEQESEFLFDYEGVVYGPFDSFFYNETLIEFRTEEMFFQFSCATRTWITVPPKNSYIIFVEEAEK